MVWYLIQWFDSLWNFTVSIIVLYSHIQYNSSKYSSKLAVQCLLFTSIVYTHSNSHLTKTKLFRMSSCLNELIQVICFFQIFTWLPFDHFGSVQLNRLVLFCLCTVVVDEILTVNSHSHICVVFLFFHHQQNTTEIRICNRNSFFFKKKEENYVIQHRRHTIVTICIWRSQLLTAPHSHWMNDKKFCFVWTLQSKRSVGWSQFKLVILITRELFNVFKAIQFWKRCDKWTTAYILS